MACFGFLSRLNIQVFLTPFYQYVLIFLVPEKHLQMLQHCGLFVTGSHQQLTLAVEQDAGHSAGDTPCSVRSVGAVGVRRGSPWDQLHSAEAEVAVLFCRGGQAFGSALPLSQNKRLDLSAVVSSAHGMSSPKHATFRHNLTLCTPSFIK